MIRECRELAMPGTVGDMAVGIVIGAAFGAIVSTLVSEATASEPLMLTENRDLRARS